MDKQQLQKLRDLPIEGVAERLGLNVRMHKALCPFHDDHHASLSFNRSKNTFRCFVCGEHGGTIDLVIRRTGKDFVDACKWLADGSNVIINEYKPSSPFKGDERGSFDAKRYERFFEHPWLSDEANRFLFDERKLDVRVIRWCRLTSWQDRQGIHWLQIPYYDKDGRLIGIQNRNLDIKKLTEINGSINGNSCSKEEIPRFRFPQGSRCAIYNLPVLKLLSVGEPLYITEGCSDCWAMLSAGHKAIAIPSATLLKPGDMKLLSTLHSQLSTEYHMYPDQDEPGERLFMQLRSFLPDIVRHQLPPGCKDYSDYYLSTLRGKQLSNK